MSPEFREAQDRLYTFVGALHSHASIENEWVDAQGRVLLNAIERVDWNAGRLATTLARLAEIVTEPEEARQMLAAYRVNAR